MGVHSRFPHDIGSALDSRRHTLQRTADGFFFALDANTGGELWRKNIGGRVHAGPMTYAVNGRQYVAIAAGNAIFSFALPE